MIMGKSNEMASKLAELPTDAGLARFYRAVSKAQALGFFKGHHGPLEETAWVHVARHHLEDIEALAAQVIGGDVRQLARFQTLISKAPQWKLSASHVPQQSNGDGKSFIRADRPALVVTTALILDRLQNEPGRQWTERAMGYYALRALAMNRALEAADQVLARSLSLEGFAAMVHASNFLGASQDPTHPHKHAAGEESHEAMAAGHSQPAPTPMAVETDEPPEFVVELDAWTPLATQLGRTFRSLIDVDTANREAPVKTLLRNLAQTIHLRGEAGARITEFADKWDGLAPAWKEFLLPPQGPLGVPEAPVDIPPLRDRCIPGQPQHGGLWEIAQFTATETDKLCPPAQALDDASSKLYAAAGAQLILAQNEWIKAKLCYKPAGEEAERCVKQEDQGYNQCTQERDDGYNQCTQQRDDGYNACARQEDRGYNRCCTWWPCSWACRAWVWVSNIVCVAWTWVSNIVCVAWTWIKNIVCVVWTWIKKIVCVAWAYVKATACAIGHVAVAAGHVVLGIGGILGGAITRTGAGILGSICKWFGVRPATRTSSSLKVVGIHLAVLHTNKVLVFAYDEGVQPVTAGSPADFTAIADSDRALCALWDPASATARYVLTNRNLFCAHQAFTENGDLLAASGQFPLPGLLKSLIPPELLAPGADKDVHVFDSITELWRRLPDMEKGRWYPTCVTLPSGKIFIVSGTNGYATEKGFGRGIQDTWQIADPATSNVGAARPAGFNFYHLYPFMHVLPSGKVFIHSKRTTRLFDPSDETFLRIAAAGLPSNRTGFTNHLYSRTGPGPGTCVLLPLIPKRNRAGTIEYPAGRILIVGGGGAEKEPEPTDPTDSERRSDGTTGYNLNSYTLATNTSEILDFASDDPQWRSTREYMRNGRVMPDSVLLPNGKVLIVGGGRTGQSGGLLAHFTSTDTEGKPDKGATDPVLEPELFDPETETWEQLCPKPIARLYHTTAVLLPDARVLVAGHDGALNMPPLDSSRYELEIYSPNYLFGPDGLSAARPAITAAPDLVPLGRTFDIETPSADEIVTVAMIRQSSVTHQINTDQRYVGLMIIETRAHRLIVQAPPPGGVAPPGFYMLFIVNRAGVPSVARWIRVGPN